MQLTRPKYPALVAVLGAALLVLVAATAAHAEVTKLFDPRLSLKGDCSTSALDPVPDPACPAGPHPPEGRLAEPVSAATDPYGNIYVVNHNESADPQTHYIDIFDSSGRYITNVSHDARVGRAVVDSEGYLYVADGEDPTLVRYDPTIYEPEIGNIAYGSEPVALPTGLSAWGGVQVGTANDHLYVSVGNGAVWELGPATAAGQPNEVIRELHPPSSNENPTQVGQLAVDSSRDRLYLVENTGIATDSVIRIYDLSDPEQLLGTIAAPPEGTFPWIVSLAVDETSGNLFVGAIFDRRKVYEFDENGTYLGTLKDAPTEGRYLFFGIDNSPLSPNEGYLYIPAGGPTTGRLYAYEPIRPPELPAVESISFDGVTESEAVLHARVNPEGSETHWVFEYVEEQSFESSGFAAAWVAGEGDLAAGRQGSNVAAAARNLEPGRAYRFRIRLESDCAPGGCQAEDESGFTTFRAPLQVPECPNAYSRLGRSASLPDCRAYELATPSDTAGLVPWAPGSWSGHNFATPPSSPSGNSLAFMVFSGSLPDLTGNGGFNGVSYASRRSENGWVTEGIGPSGSQAAQSASGGLSPDHEYLVVEGNHQGTLLVGEDRTTLVRQPDGSFRLAGEGSIGIDPRATVHHISSHGTHTIIESRNVGNSVQAVQLEPNAPPAGTAALYDRTADGQLHVVSLLPGEVTPPAGGHAKFLGASYDGSVVAFDIGASIYVRVDNAETLPVAAPGATFAGVSDLGRFVFFVAQGDLYRFDTETESTLRITELGDVDPVNVAPNGNSGYFISSDATVTAENPEGAVPQPGEPNLYRWEGNDLDFVATVTLRDVTGEADSTVTAGGLGLWLEAVAVSKPAILASRTTPDGDVLLFESRADLTGFVSDGKAQVYRYDHSGETLTCLSCDPTGATPNGDSTLVASLLAGSGPGAIGSEVTGISPYADMRNLSPDGRRAFFETSERLTVTDTDGLSDVYEWEAEGKGSCADPDGCLFLISSGKSGRPEHLFGVSDSGDDVFVLSGDLLTPEDASDTPSVYDVRVGGGFPPAASDRAECLGEACQPTVGMPSDPPPNSASYSGPGNVASPKKPRRPCRNGRRAVRRQGKVRCLRQKRRSRKHRNKNNNRAAATRGDQK